MPVGIPYETEDALAAEAKARTQAAQEKVYSVVGKVHADALAKAEKEAAARQQAVEEQKAAEAKKLEEDNAEEQKRQETEAKKAAQARAALVAVKGNAAAFKFAQQKASEQEEEVRIAADKLTRPRRNSIKSQAKLKKKQEALARDEAAKTKQEADAQKAKAAKAATVAAAKQRTLQRKASKSSVEADEAKWVKEERIQTVKMISQGGGDAAGN